MVSTTRPISCRTDDSRSGVFSLPWKYFDATMLVAVWDQVLGTSTFSWRKIVWPFSLLDRKSTRLNSSHANISYAVFCLKKKKKIISEQDTRFEKYMSQ